MVRCNIPISHPFPIDTFVISPESMDMGRSDAVDRDRRLRLANSSPDVKALFNAPAYIYNLDEHVDPEAAFMPEPAIEYWTPMPPIVCLSIFDCRIKLRSR